jgi:hypothetical protein
VNIVVGSAFRNCEGRIDSYLQQVANLQAHAGSNNHVRVIAVEGDSKDHTANSLIVRSARFNIDLTTVTLNHGKRHFGSTEEPERLVALSKVGNAIFDAVNEKDDVLLYVESDLLWTPHAVGSLMDMALRREEGFDVFAPRVMAHNAFYDTWGFRHMDGTRFSPFEKFPEHIVEVSSAGSCLVMRTEIARKCRIRDNYCLVGWCRDAQANGYRIGVDPRFKINHP